MYKQPKEIANVHENLKFGQFLNIYFDHERPGHLNTLVSSCVTVELDYLPYMLTFAEVPLFFPKISETVFICGGSDQAIHLYLEDKERHTYIEVSY